MTTAPNTRILFKSDEGYQRAQALYDLLMKRVTVPYTTTFVETPTGSTHVICAGPQEGFPVVLLHGQGACAPTLWAFINGLSPLYRVYAIDVPSSMGKSTPNKLPRAGTGAGDWLAAAMDALGVESAHLAGISNGAWLILKLATAAPQKIRSAVLMSAAGLVRTSPRLMFKAAPLILKMQLGFGQPKEMAMQFLKTMGVPGQEPMEEDLEMFQVLLGYFRTDPTPKPMSDTELRCLTAPTYLMIGQYEMAFPAPESIDRAKAVLPNLKKAEVVPGVGHGMEDGDAITRRMLAFWREVEHG